MSLYLIFDTETTGFPKNFNAPLTDEDNWPRLVQLAWQLHDAQGQLIENHNHIIYPDGFDIPFNATKVHGISTQMAKEKGIPLQEALEHFYKSLEQKPILVGHNIMFDVNVVGAEYYRTQKSFEFLTSLPTLDTKDESTQYCAIPGGRGGGYKWPTLSELHQKLFDHPFEEAHNAAADVNATARCFFELIRLKVLSATKAQFSEADFLAFLEFHPTRIEPYDIEVGSQIADKDTGISTSEVQIKDDQELETLTASPFFHFHNHTAFSILSATTKVGDLVKKAVKENMPAVGITDMGNMMGAYQFLDEVKKINETLEKPIVPIVGCELYISENYKQTKFTKDQPDRRYTQVILAKNKKGYHNLAKICSEGYINGYYAGYPRVGKEVILEFKEELIATTGSLTSEIPNKILNQGETQAEEAFQWWHKAFGDDFYIELIRHGLEEEEHVNQILLNWSKKYGVKVLAQNNTFYLDQEEADAHDILLCVRDGEKKETPIGRGRGFRFGFPNHEFYFKSQAQMTALFQDVPDAIENLESFIENFEPYHLKQDTLLPKFNIPEEFVDPKDEEDGGKRGENAYLKHLTYEGAKNRYGTITPEIKERLDFELETIENTGYPGYFLIVQDFTSQARKMGVSVGPGRGSAAGSAVAYCIGITNVDPIKYDLLFERFLNPDRVSLPDIDIDFDDRGRDEIIQWVIDKYGKDQVAQIITYGTMAGKSAVRDTGRVLDLPLSDTDRIAKKIHLKLGKLFGMNEKELGQKLNSDQLPDAKEILKLSSGDDLAAATINQARLIEGSIRNTGVHACGVIISPKDLKEVVPVSVAKDSDLAVTQFDNSVVENAGLLKMDFLGLKTLTIIKDAVKLVKERHGIDLDPDEFPLDDATTYEKVFKPGNTTAIFQYESDGMKKHLRALEPDKFEDLIAMNALYRPGPLQYIPNFIARKHGREEITYDLPEMEEYLKDTYGITVYQEQVMLLSQKLGNFSKGEADVLRKAMGKKQRDVLDKMKGKFIEQAISNGHPEDVLNKIWTDWEAFAQYAFNKSHSTCYAFVAFQTAYLKAHYPAEFMAAVLSNNMNQIKTVSLFMSECKRMGIPVLGPDVNESSYYFGVNPKGAVRFGLGAIKGVGNAAVESIIQEREENGKYISIYDFVKRVDLRQCNKKTLENLVLAGGFDELDSLHRARYFMEDDHGETNIEKLIKFGQSFQEGSNQNQISLFDAADIEIEIQEPTLPNCAEWPSLIQLSKEKEVVGIYISAHPLDDYAHEIKLFADIELAQIKDQEEKWIGRPVSIAGLVTDFKEMRSNRDGKEFGIFTLEDYSESYEFRLFGEDYLKFKHFLAVNRFLYIKLNITQNQYSKRVYVNISQIDLLVDVLDKYAQKLWVEIPLGEINESAAQQLISILKKHTGNASLHVRFRIDTPQTSYFSSSSKSHKVNICADLLNDLEQINGVDFRLN